MTNNINKTSELSQEFLEARRKRDRLAKQKVRKKNRNAGLCICGRERTDKRFKACESCRERSLLQLQKQQKRNKRSGLCVCGKRRLNKKFITCESCRERSRLNYQKNPEKDNERNKRWRKENAERNRARIREYERARRESDPQYKFIQNMRNRCWKALNGKAKSESIQDWFGCTFDELVEHMESLFQPGMTWGNQGEWHTDHIKPLALFGSSPEEQRKAWHYTNLQPLWASENRRKATKYSGD